MKEFMRRGGNALRGFYQEMKRHLLTVWIAVLVVGGVVLAILMMSRSPVTQISQAYQSMKEWQLHFEERITSLENVYAALFVLLLLYVLRSLLPFLPITILHIAAGLIYPTPIALGVNLLGLFLNITVKYHYGRLLGGGNAGWLLSRYDRLQEAVRPKGGNIWLLFLLRLFPGLPDNMVSRLYGSLGCRYAEYCIVSLAGMFPRMALYTFVGNAVLDPFSERFLVSVAMLLLFSLLSAWGGRYLLHRGKKKGKGKRKPSPPG